jgi:hypothetical protein
MGVVHTGFQWGNLKKKKTYLDDVSEDEKIISNRIFKRQDRECVDRNDLVQDKARCQSTVDMVMKHWVA